MANFNQQPQNEPLIPSPYNFVPLSEQVFFPGWADQVSMDVPFSDGISGTLQVKVTAKTPLYIRNGGAHPEDKSKLNDPNYTDFFRVHPDGPYAIPGTSLKGMLRAVVEIASFGKIAGTPGRMARVSNHRYAVRDLRTPELYGHYFTQPVSGAYKPKVRAAWLSEGEKEEWQLSFGKFSRVEQEDLEALFHVELGRKQSTEDKYGQFSKTQLSINFDPEPEANYSHTTNLPLRYSKAANLLKGKTLGVIVFTGQPSDRKPRGCKNKNGQPCSRGKHMEFIFFNKGKDAVPVLEAVKKDFIFAHSELGENRKPNDEWRFWKKRMDNGEPVPVFVLMDEQKPTEISSMGLAMMFRLPYKNDIHQTIAHTGNGIHLQAEKMDLAELIFGRVEDQDALRGRVAIETLVAEGEPKPMGEVLTVLGAPKPTYYPNYVRQQADQGGRVKGNYKTYMDDTAEIRGWKRYFVTKDNVQMPKANPPPTNKEGKINLDVATKFHPLPAETAFTGTIHVHNLRPQELGALIWAITWGGDKKLRHTLGMGKPYGFGSITVEITGNELSWCNPASDGKPDVDSGWQSFEAVMAGWRKEWAQSDQVRALKIMANPGADWPQDERYPSLGDGPKTNEFAQHKDKRAQHALIDPLNVKVGQAQKPAQPAGVPKPLVEQSPEDKFIAEMDKLSMADSIKRLQKLDREKVPAEKRKLIYQKMKKKPGSENWNFKSILDQWKVD